MARSFQRTYINTVFPNSINLGTTVSNLKTDEALKINGSPNNSIINKSNTQRTNERIPDIYGTVLAAPDLMAPSYIAVRSGIYYEINYYCVGKGSFTLSDLRLNGYPFASVPGLLHDIYEPNNSPGTSAGSVATPLAGAKEAKRDPEYFADKAFLLTQNPWGSELDYSLLRAPNDTGGVYSKYPAEYGPFVFDNVKGFLVNLEAPNGGSYSTTTVVTVQMTYQNYTAANVATGPAYTQTTTVTFTAPNVGERKTIYSSIPITGRVGVKIKRTTAVANPAFGYNTPFITGVYGLVQNTKTHFGDVTTIRVAVPLESQKAIGAANKFTCLAARKISGVVTSKVKDIAKAVCLDTYIGNRLVSSIDDAGLIALQTEVEAYFGTALAGQFNYTFDNDNLSFEETLATVLNAAFMYAYSEDGVIKFAFDKPDVPSKLILNHRNKIPDSEIRSVTFGNLDEKDGVEYQYTDTATGITYPFVLPSDGSAINPDTGGPVGIVNKLQLYFHGHRTLNRIKYQNTVTEFEATQEANILRIGDVITVADNTRTETHDGEIVAKSGLTLTLSQPFYFVPGKTATIHLQNITGAVEEIEVFEVVGNPYQVTLDVDVSQPISISASAFTKAAYEIIIEDSVRRGKFKVIEKTQSENLTVNIVAINYDERYFDNDKDFIDNVVDIDGNL